MTLLSIKFYISLYCCWSCGQHNHTHSLTPTNILFKNTKRKKAIKLELSEEVPTSFFNLLSFNKIYYEVLYENFLNKISNIRKHLSRKFKPIPLSFLTFVFQRAELFVCSTSSDSTNRAITILRSSMVHITLQVVVLVSFLLDSGQAVQAVRHRYSWIETSSLLVLLTK